MDGNWKNITGSVSGYGIYIENANNVTVKNVNVLNYFSGVYLSGSTNCNIASNTIYNNGIGIYILHSSNNLIYNNLFNNTNNVFIYNSQNTWNTTLTQGKNIVGGNFWAKPDGNGFSQTCEDSNSDGICDEPYRIDDNNIDYLLLPLRSSIIA